MITGPGRNPKSEPNRPYQSLWIRARYSTIYLLHGPDEATVQAQIIQALKPLRVVVWETDAGGKKTLGRLSRALHSMPILKRLIPAILAAARGFLPAGHSDLTGYMPDGRAIFLEVKAPEKINTKGTQERPAGKPTPEQLSFLDPAAAAGCVVGVVWSPWDAVEIIRAAGKSA